MGWPPTPCPQRGHTKSKDHVMSVPMAITMMEAANLDRYSRPTKEAQNQRPYCQLDEYPFIGRLIGVSANGANGGC